jgi:D-amino-acid oxidase
MSAVRGQVVLLEQIGIDRWYLDHTDPQELTYVIPRGTTIVAGGTANEGDERMTPDAVTARRILERCQRIVPELREARVLDHRVGLRPARPAVRLELAHDHATPVVHCYGHGGAGVTLAYGCAEDVAKLVTDI